MLNIAHDRTSFDMIFDITKFGTLIGYNLILLSLQEKKLKFVYGSVFVMRLH